MQFHTSLIVRFLKVLFKVWKQTDCWYSHHLDIEYTICTYFVKETKWGRDWEGVRYGGGVRWEGRERQARLSSNTTIDYSVCRQDRSKLEHQVISQSITGRELIGRISCSVKLTILNINIKHSLKKLIQYHKQLLSLYVKYSGFTRHPNMFLMILSYICHAKDKKLTPFTITKTQCPKLK